MYKQKEDHVEDYKIVYSPLNYPLSIYTLLYPHGDLGQTFALQQNSKKITLMKYYSNRLHFTDKFGPIYYDSVFHTQDYYQINV